MDVLVEAAEGAEMLIVGHRGRRSVASLLLGSVGLHCVLHAPCPITVVRQQSVTVAETARAPKLVGATAEASPA